MLVAVCDFYYIHLYATYTLLYTYACWLPCVTFLIGDIYIVYTLVCCLYTSIHAGCRVWLYIQVTKALSQLSQYKLRYKWAILRLYILYRPYSVLSFSVFRSRLKAKNLMYVNHILDILNCLLRAVSGILCWTMYMYMRQSTCKTGITWHKIGSSVHIFWFGGHKPFLFRDRATFMQSHEILQS